MDAHEATLRFGDTIMPYVTAIVFLSGAGPENYTITNNATGGFVDTGKAKLLVTNAHVLQAYDAKRQEDESLQLVIGASGKSLSLDRNWVRDYDKKTKIKLDLAVFVLPDDFNIAAIGKTFYRPQAWPPARVAKGQLVVIAGFPGNHRTQEGSTGTMSINVIADPVSAVNDVSFVLADENVERVLVKVNPKLVELGDFGGMSGSPAFRFVEDGDFSLVGFLHETGDELNAFIRVVHADFVREDGLLDFGLLP